MSDHQNQGQENYSPASETEKTAQQLAKMFAALAHPARARIVLELGRGELCVNDLSEMLKISHSSVSQHLAILRSQALIKEQKAGRFVFYRLVQADIAGWLTGGEKFTDLSRVEPGISVGSGLTQNQQSSQQPTMQESGRH